MKTKRLISLAPLLAIVALAVIPRAAQAAGAKWTKNGAVLANGKPEPTISWGTLSLESSAGNVSCKNAVAGNVENTSTEPQNSSATALFATYECKNSGGECPLVAGTETVVAEGLPWRSNVEEKEVGDELYRAKGSGIKVDIICTARGKEAAHLVFSTGKVGETEGTSTPAWLNGSTAGRPSEVSFDAESGHLGAEAEVEIGEAGETPFQKEMETTFGSDVIKGKELVNAGVRTGNVVNGLSIKTDGNKPPANLTIVSAVSETEVTLTEVTFNGTEYVPAAEGKAGATGKFTLQFNPGSGKFATTTILGCTKGRLKVEGDEGTPAAVFTLGPGGPTEVAPPAEACRPAAIWFQNGAPLATNKITVEGSLKGSMGLHVYGKEQPNGLNLKAFITCSATSVKGTIAPPNKMVLDQYQLEKCDYLNSENNEACGVHTKGEEEGVVTLATQAAPLQGELGVVANAQAPKSERGLDLKLTPTTLEGACLGPTANEGSTKVDGSVIGEIEKGTNARLLPLEYTEGPGVQGGPNQTIQNFKGMPKDTLGWFQTEGSLSGTIVLDFSQRMEVS